MNNLKAKIHDECLEHESDIWDYVEMLGDQRVKNYETGEIEDLNLIIPILNGISDEVERYKEYIQEVIKENEWEIQKKIIWPWIRKTGSSGNAAT